MCVWVCVRVVCINTCIFVCVCDAGPYSVCGYVCTMHVPVHVCERE